MQMIECPNCGKLTGFKRSLGFGTFFMVVLTCGFWLLAIPFYPMRCISCGLTRNSAVMQNFAAWYRSLSPHNKTFMNTAGGILLLILGVMWFNGERNPAARDSLSSLGSTDYGGDASNTSAASVIHISAENLLAEFQRSESDKEVRIKNESLSTYLNDKTETAEDRYKGKRIQVTGIVTGVFIPSIETSRRVLESRGSGIFDEQGGAGSFITMGGPYPHSVEETLLLPGITAWSKTGGSLQPTFGQPNIESLAGRLVVGKQVSILCTFKSSSASSPTEISVSLEDCTLESLPPLLAPHASPPSPTPENIVSAINAEDSSPQNRSKPYLVDADLESDVRRALSTSEALKSAVITPVSLHREVTLSGTVMDESSRELAEKITSQVSGVIEVYNDLTIRDGASAHIQSGTANNAQRVSSDLVTKDQTSTEVLAILGPPASVTMGAKSVYTYPNLKVVFVDGKVSEIQHF